MKAIDLHIHGGFNVNFDNANQQEIKDFAKEAYKAGIVAFCPTLTGDTPEKLNEKINIIKDAKLTQGKDEAKIIGAHLEGTFLSPDKPGIQDKSVFLEPTIDNFNKISKGVEEFIKIVVIAPENRDCTDFINHLKAKNIKVHFGHTMTDDIKGADGLCHLFNAMDVMTHKKSTLPIKALLSDSIYTELIADLKHVNIDVLRLVFKVRPADKILLISDALPIAGSNLSEITFCGKKIYANGKDENGTLGGSIMLLPQIAKQLADLKIMPENLIQKMIYDNQIDYLKLIV